MKTYYLVAEKQMNAYTVFVSDVVGPGRTELMHFQVERYSDAVKMVSFSATGMGKTAICGVSGTGKPFAEVIW